MQDQDTRSRRVVQLRPGQLDFLQRGAALTSTLHGFETEMLASEENLLGLMALNRELVGQAEAFDDSERSAVDYGTIQNAEGGLKYSSRGSLSVKPTISNGLVVTIVFLTGTLQAQQREPVTISVGISLANQYLWRGFVSNDAPSAQPGMTVEFTNFSISSWSNFSQTGPNGQLWTEHDLMLDYTQPVGSFSLSIGYINYIFPDIEPGEGRQTNEVYFGLAHDNLLSPSVTVYRDFDEGEGWYYYLSLGHAFKLPKGLSLNPSVGVGLNQHLFIEQTTVSNCDLGVSIDITLGGITLSPFFTRMIGNRSIFGSHNMYGVTMSLNN